jgi:cyclic pyranopterin phosphate synthase
VKDRFGREISYLRVSVTDRCNLRCRYCVGQQGVALLPRERILSFEEIAAVVEQGARMGVRKVRLTGGEPLVRRNISGLVAAISRIKGVEDLAMSTNGSLLEQHAGELVQAGLVRVNVSLDTIDPERYRYLTGGGEVRRVLAGIAAARAAGLEPVKLNCVTGGPCSDADRLSVKQYAREQGLPLRTIPRMDFARGSFSVVQGGSGGDCRNCNRLRLSSDGRIRPCLFSDLSYDVRELGAEQALRQAVAHKPQAGRCCTHDWMHGIGG